MSPCCRTVSTTGTTYARSTVLRQLKARGLWKELPARGRSGVLLISHISTGSGIRALFTTAGHPDPPNTFPEALQSDHSMQWCEHMCLISHLTKLHQACDAKANEKHRGGLKASAVAVRKVWASKARKYRSHLTWMTEMRRRVSETESDNMADMVLSQGGTSITSVVRYQYKLPGYGRRYSSLLSVQRCSNLIRAHALPVGTQDFDIVNAMTNFVVQAMRKLDLPEWLPLKELSHWTHYADHTTELREKMQAHLGVGAKRVIMSVAHGGAVPEVNDEDTHQWLKGLSEESRLLRWIACSDFVDLHTQFIDESKAWPENSTFAYWWQTLEDRVFVLHPGGGPCIDD